MNVGMVLWNYFPHDVRVEKEADSLRAAGHDVSLLCLGEEDDPTRESVGGIDVHRVYPWDRFTFVQRNLARVGYTATGRHYTWGRAIDGFAAETDADALHVHDLPLVDTALWVGERRGLPVVADLHENYPEAMRQWRQGMATWDRMRGTLLNPVWRLKRREKRAVTRADATLCITLSGYDHYLAVGADPEDVHVVSNTVDLDAFDPDEVEPVEGYEDEFVVGYVGSFGPHRGLETAIDAMPELLESRPDARLLLVGSAGEEAYDEALRERCRDRGIEDRVTFTGWVDLEDVPNYIAACDVPFVVHDRNPHTATTVPHKLFQYMALRKPVLVSTVPTLARPVAEYDAGHAVDPGDTAAFADACVDLADHERYAEMSANARRAVEETYNWAHEGERLVAVYDGLRG